MLSTNLATYAEQRFNARRSALKARLPIIDAALEACDSTDEAILMRYLYATLPITDCIDVDPGILRGYVRHALFLHTECAWTQELSETLFVHFVLCPRINNEPLVDCRHTFYSVIRHRVEGLDMAAAVREINYWCSEMVTYQATNQRTLNPLAVWGCGHGRCGEESTFVVTALRSLGIPARQIYTPWWAHTDDNHAWVEAYTTDRWHYLGACEPEMELDRGWFTHAAGRALVEETRIFSDFNDDPTVGNDAGVVGSTHLINVTDAYSTSADFQVQVTHGGKPVAGAVVTFEVLNSAEWLPIASLVCDENGMVRLKIGSGSLRIRASHCDFLGQSDVDGRTIHHAHIELHDYTDAVHIQNEWHDVDIVAPADHPAPSHPQTHEQDSKARLRKVHSDTVRRERIEKFLTQAQTYADTWPQAQRAFSHAYANAPEIAAFLAIDQQPDRFEILNTLNDKDFCDIRTDVLESHLTQARLVQPQAETRLRKQGLSADDAHELFVTCVLNPRTQYEEISAYRPAILQFFSDEQREAFCAQPRTLWTWLDKHLSFESTEGLAKIIGTPEGALTCGIASAVTKAHVFVAVCRTFGIAARIDPQTARPEFMENGVFVAVQHATKLPRIPCVVTCPTGADPAYFSTWSLGRLTSFVAPNGHETLGFQSLDLTGSTFKNDRLELMLEPGVYRFITTIRLPNGNQQASEYITQIFPNATSVQAHEQASAQAGEHASAQAGGQRQGQDHPSPLEICLKMRTPAPHDLLNHIVLPPFELDGDMSALTRTHGMSIVAFIEEGREPTEHLLNELRERSRELHEAHLPLTLVMRTGATLSDPTLVRTRAALPDSALAFDSFEDLPERLARRTYTNPELLPLTLLVMSSPAHGDKDNADKEDTNASSANVQLTSLFATAGYGVGTVDLILRLARAAEAAH